MSLKIIYEDNHLIAVNKPAGALVQGDETGDMPLSETIKLYIKERYNKPGDVYLGVIHRLDRPVSGVVVFARTSKALERMNKLFQDRKVEKTYWALTAENPQYESGHLTDYLIKDEMRNVARVVDKPSKRNPDAKLSELDYELLGRIGEHCLLEIKPITGRPHQIRVQLANIGCPIRGDVKYGFPKANKDGSLHLHCKSLAFIHPVKNEPVLIEADLPRDNVWKLFE